MLPLEAAHLDHSTHHLLLRSSPEGLTPDASVHPSCVLPSSGDITSLLCVMTSEKTPLLSSMSSHHISKSNYVLVIHGGAGTMIRESSTPEQRRRYKTALANALQAGYQVLQQGGEAMDAAVAAVTSMESKFTCQLKLVADENYFSRLSAI
jgi:hypothetical protein